MSILEVDLIRLRGLMYRKQTEISEKSGLAPSTIIRKVSGKRDFLVSDLNKIAIAGGFDVADFVKFVEVDQEGN